MEYKLVPVKPTVEMHKAFWDQWVYGGETVEDCYEAMLAAAPAPAWIPVSERLPTEEDADENGFVWVCAEGACEAWTEDWENGLEWLRESSWDYWMPKPRQQPPAPPTAREGE